MVFKMLHLDIQNNVIVSQTGILHGVDHGIFISQCYSKVQHALLHSGHMRYNPSTLHNNNDHEFVDKEAKTIGYIGGHDHFIVINFQDPFNMCSLIAHSNVSHHIEFL